MTVLQSTPFYDAYWCILPHLPVAYVNLSKALDANEDYYVVIITDNHLNKMARWLVVNIGQYDGGGSVKDGWDMEGVDP
jgi:hypothetical protein